ncbi:MAG TPA: transcription termination factor NusA [Blastocatellia bacterium]|nr:transcription termination factor NusA [Blastocatellia bacterium]
MNHNKAMNPLSSLAQNIELLSKEKKIDPQIIIGAIEDAVVTASRKHFKTGEDLRARYNLENGLIELYAIKTVVQEVTDDAREMSVEEAIQEVGEGVEPGDMLELPRPMEDLGRIAAQTAKQIIMQKVREAERNNIYEEYISRIGELINGYVKRFEGGRMIVDIGNGVEAVMPKSQQSRHENFAQGERIRCVISDVSREAKGPQIEVSRTSPELVKRLFEMEVPEIYDGTVVIKAAVREPGDRAKIAVMSNERDVDPVGACVGMKGSRVQSIIRELRGEKIDIIEWSEDPAIFAANALSPAKVSKVSVVDFETKKLQVTVDSEQQSLAIGKRGQNVRLAARLVGWDIDIRSEEDIKREIAMRMEQIATADVVPLSYVEGLTASDVEILAEHDIETVEQLAEANIDDLCDWLDLSVDDAEQRLEAAQQLLAARQAKAGGAASGGDDSAAEDNFEADAEEIEEGDEEASFTGGPEEESSGDAALEASATADADGISQSVEAEGTDSSQSAEASQEVKTESQGSNAQQTEE